MSWDMASWAIEKERQQDMLRAAEAYRLARSVSMNNRGPSRIARMAGAVRRFMQAQSGHSARRRLSADQETGATGTNLAGVGGEIC
jgi:hypothetical protein